MGMLDFMRRGNENQHFSSPKGTKIDQKNAPNN